MTTVPASTEPSAKRGRRTSAPEPTLIHSGATVDRYFANHFRGAVFPMAAGLFLYGWRAVMVIAIVVGSTVALSTVWRRIGRRGRDLSLWHAAWLGFLLALTLPADLGSPAGISSTRAAFWILPAAGCVLAIVLWVLRGMSGTGFHPVAVAVLILAGLFHDRLIPQHVLQRDEMFLGDVLDAPPASSADLTGPQGMTAPWFEVPTVETHDALRMTPASESLNQYTRRPRATRDATGVVLIQALLRDRLPPLEDLVMAGNPGPIGASSVIFVIVGGLFLLYRGVVDYRIPMLIVLFAFVSLLVLPIPIAITDSGSRWVWVALREPSVGAAVAVTFANYQIAASPLLLVAFFLATAPTVRPITRRGRTLFAIAVGILSAAAQLYVSVAWGPYLALVVAGAMTPVLDWFFQPRPLA